MPNLTKLLPVTALAAVLGISTPAFSCDHPDSKDHAHKECDMIKDNDCKDDHHDEKSHSNHGGKPDHDHKESDGQNTVEKSKN